MLGDRKGDVQVFDCILNASNDRYTITSPWIIRVDDDDDDDI